MIGAISGFGSAALFNPYSYGLNRSAQAQSPQQAGSLWATRRSSPEAPVEPVRPVKAVAPQDSQPRLLPNSLPSLREGADPTEMAVRMRIQYADPADGSQTDGVDGAEASLGAEDVRAVAEEAECQTCAKRKYQDGSDDPGVSFKTPTNIDPSQAASAVRGHEMEHVVREQSKARQQDRKVVSQSVTYHTAICPECGKVYISGGTTRTVTAANDQPDAARSQQEDRQGAQGFFAAA